MQDQIFALLRKLITNPIFLIVTAYTIWYALTAYDDWMTAAANLKNLIDQ
jgi:hypothetical protein